MVITKTQAQPGSAIAHEVPRRIRMCEPLLDRCALITDPKSVIPKLLSLVQAADANYPIEKVGRNLSRAKMYVRERHLELLRDLAENGTGGQSERAMRVLGDLADHSSIPILIAKLMSSDTITGTEAAIAIGKMAGELSPDQREEIRRMASGRMPVSDDYREAERCERECAAGIVALAEMGKFRAVFVYLKEYLVGKAEVSSEMHITEDRVVRAVFLALGRKAQESGRLSGALGKMIRVFESSEWFRAQKAENNSVYKVLESHFADLGDARKCHYATRAAETVHHILTS